MFPQSFQPMRCNLCIEKMAPTPADFILMRQRRRMPHQRQWLVVHCLPAIPFFVIAFEQKRKETEFVRMLRQRARLRMFQFRQHQA